MGTSQCSLLPRPSHGQAQDPSGPVEWLMYLIKSLTPASWLLAAFMSHAPTDSWSSERAVWQPAVGKLHTGCGEGEWWGKNYSGGTIGPSQAGLTSATALGRKRVLIISDTDIALFVKDYMSSSMDSSGRHISKTMRSWEKCTKTQFLMGLACLPYDRRGFLADRKGDLSGGQTLLRSTTLCIR